MLHMLNPCQRKVYVSVKGTSHLMRNVWTQKTQINTFYNWAPEVAQSVIRFGHIFSLWCWLHALLKLTVIFLTRSLLVVRFLLCNTVCAEWNIILRRSRIVCGAVAIENAIHAMPSYAESDKQHNRNCFILYSNSLPRSTEYKTFIM